MKFCPLCATPLKTALFEQKPRLNCADPLCGYVYWDNPVPVVAGIVETADGVVLAHNVAWPDDIYSVITGYLESGESPEAAIIRETQEELNLLADAASLLGVYSFNPKNQVILAYHLKASGQIRLNHELDKYQIIAIEKLPDRSFTSFTLTETIISDWLT